MASAVWWHVSARCCEKVGDRVGQLKLVYTHPNSMVVGSMASLLAQVGIETEFRNELLGGAAGELAPGETWVELWVVDNRQAGRAKQMIQDLIDEPERDDWICNACQETNPASFEICWQCGKPEGSSGVT